jgi:alpha-glucoside transport system permease protein
VGGSRCGLPTSGVGSGPDEKGGSVVTHLATAPARNTSEDTKQHHWLTPVVWLAIVAAIGTVIYYSLSPGGKPILYTASNEHSWFVDMIFKPTTVAQKLSVMVLAIVLFVAVIALILWAVDRRSVPKPVLIAGFLGPVVIALTSGLLWSALKTILQSFQKFDQFGTQIGWAGWANYGHIFTGANKEMLINTVVWILVAPIFSTLFGLVYAVLVDRTRFEAFAKALVFLPMAISMVAASVMWKYIYYAPAPKGRSQIGMLNALLDVVGIAPVNWTTVFPVGTFALIIVMIWIQTGLAMTLLSASIKAIPDEIIEAARIDGATGWVLFKSITVPSIRPTIVVVLTTVAIASLKTFDIVNVMGNNLGVNNILANAFYSWMSVQQPGWAGAAAVLIFIVVIPVIVFNVRQMRKSEAVR